MYFYICAYLYVYACMCARVCVYECVYVFVYLCDCTYVFVCVCTRMCMYDVQCTSYIVRVWVCVCFYVFVCEGFSKTSPHLATPTSTSPYHHTHFITPTLPHPLRYTHHTYFTTPLIHAYLDMPIWTRLLATPIFLPRPFCYLLCRSYSVGPTHFIVLP